MKLLHLIVLLATLVAVTLGAAINEGAIDEGAIDNAAIEKLVEEITPINKDTSTGTAQDNESSAGNTAGALYNCEGCRVAYRQCLRRTELQLYPNLREQVPLCACWTHSLRENMQVSEMLGYVISHMRSQALIITR
ncbi:hypothetical protein BDV95DRAFT_595863 [Massariosphaeria phaeospora]|uniref:Uncharacterized protein n=1 Tax=Massariosphaeria phaeospora TaxID=100035 RepID=A0A7C8IC36_9PLEO|nr:hypothetical protein BDV95DRAFT_595863 [Massariosphaeria phaeospora]